jgi:hypothetical protein
MRRVGPTPRRGAALVPLLLAAAALGATLAPDHARAELGEGSSLGEYELPDWIPSVGFGFGIQARKAEGGFAALLKSDSADRELFNCRASIFGINPDAESCDFFQQDEETVDGGTIPGGLQLLGPAWSGDLPFGLSIRPLVHAGAAWNFDRRLIARQGFEQPDMEVNGVEADLRAEIEGEPRWFWYTGIGTAIRLPFERPTFLKIAGNYHEQRVNAFGRVDRGQSVGTTFLGVNRLEEEEELTIKGLGPSIGLETEVARIGPVSFGFAADLMITFPLSGTDWSTSVSQVPLLTPSDLSVPGAAPCAPGQEPETPPPLGTGVFCYDNIDFNASFDNPFYFGGVQVRISWIGW